MTLVADVYERTLNDSAEVEHFARHERLQQSSNGPMKHPKGMAVPGFAWRKIKMVPLRVLVQVS